MANTFGTNDAVVLLRDELAKRLQFAVIRIDAPAAGDGSWWIDVEDSGRSASVEWRPDLGYGVSRANGAYGEGHDLIVESAASAADAIFAMIRATGPALDTPSKTRSPRRRLIELKDRADTGLRDLDQPANFERPKVIRYTGNAARSSANHISVRQSFVTGVPPRASKDRNAESGGSTSGRTTKR